MEVLYKPCEMGMIPENKKGGIASNVILGIGGLVIAVIVILVIVSTATGLGLVGNDKTYTITKLNETITFDDVNTIQTLAAFSYATADNQITCNALTYVANQTQLGASIATNKITKSGCTVINASAMDGAGWGGNGTVFLSYTYTTTVVKSHNQIDNLSSNFTSGINNISSKIPTILLIIVVVVLFGFLVLLVRNTNLMGSFGGREGSL